jgi:predicted methyltransferase
MRKIVMVVAAACVMASPLNADAGGQIAAAVASPDRPVADSSRDAARKPAEVLAFSGIKPGDVVADIVPGKGYFTRLFSKLTGPQGKVFAVVPAELLSKLPTAADGVKAIATSPAFANVTVVVTPTGTLAVPQAVDVCHAASWRCVCGARSQRPPR